MYLWVIATISSPVRQFSKSISLISSNMYNLLPWFCSPGKLSSLLLANQVICIFQGPLYRPTFTLEDLHRISFYCYHYSAKHTAWSTELWHSSQINKQKPVFPDSWCLGVSKELIFPTLDLVINLFFYCVWVFFLRWRHVHEFIKIWKSVCSSDTFQALLLTTFV